MAYTSIRFNGSKPLSLGSKRGKEALRSVANHLLAELSGAGKVESFGLINSEAAGISSHAAAICKMATGTGTVGLVINGTSVTVTWATSDTASQAALVTAINANSTVAALGVVASQYVAVLTLSSLASASVIDVCGVKFIAGTDFSVAGTDNQDAAAFAVAINANAKLAAKLVAVPDASAGVLYLALLESRAARSGETITLDSGSGLTITSQFAAAAYSVVYAQTPGAIGNACTVTATGTNTTAHSAVSGKLGGGVNAAPSFLTSDYR